jgi:alginate O-acetyltransferase complex protein AlgI
MLFSTGIFLFLFLPLSLLAFYLSPKKYRNAILFVFSFVFYAWGGVNFSLLLLLSLVMNYFVGLWIDKSIDRKKLALGLGVGLNLSLLVIFKYTNFAVENANVLFERIQVPPLPHPEIVLPIGISFFTFQAISYQIDIYRKEAIVQKNFINLSLYISLFPQLIAGPIVRYHDIATQLVQRSLTISKFRSGIERIIIGLSKKVLLANTFAYVADQVFSTPFSQLDSSAAWLGIISYSLQIYFDFSGYSDMAIGLGRMFGFEFMENFNFPYIARSIKEFWRRWHISLSSWFRDYLYIPLGGNRNGSVRTYVNLMIVFFLTGFWHGASWSFIVWGLFHGLFLVIERLGFDGILKKMGRVPSHLYTLIIVVIGWVFFRVEKLGDALDFLVVMFSFNGSDGSLLSWLNFINPQLYFAFPIAIISSAYIFPRIHEYITIKTAGNNLLIGLGKMLSLVFLLAAFILCVLYILSDSYNPFIYFRF